MIRQSNPKHEVRHTNCGIRISYFNSMFIANIQRYFSKIWKYNS